MKLYGDRFTFGKSLKWTFEELHLGTKPSSMDYFWPSDLLWYTFLLGQLFLTADTAVISANVLGGIDRLCFCHTQPVFVVGNGNESGTCLTSMTW